MVGVRAVPASATPTFKVYDTAWAMPARASVAEITVYLDHLETSGFDGAWISVVPFYYMGGDSADREEYS